MLFSLPFLSHSVGIFYSSLDQRFTSKNIIFDVNLPLTHSLSYCAGLFFLVFCAQLFIQKTSKHFFPFQLYQYLFFGFLTSKCQLTYKSYSTQFLKAIKEGAEKFATVCIQCFCFNVANFMTCLSRVTRNFKLFFFSLNENKSKNVLCLQTFLLHLSSSKKILLTLEFFLNMQLGF